MLTGDVIKRPYPEHHRRKLKKLTEEDQFFILELVIEHPGIYLKELRHELLVSKATQASMATICRFLHSCAFSRTRIRSIALQRNEEKRAKYVAEVALYTPSMFVFVDEMGSDLRDGLRKFGYSARGQRCVATRLLERGECISVIGALTVSGILGYQFIHGTSNGDVFQKFVEIELLPQLLPFNGSNDTSIVVLDNASIHHSQAIFDLVSSVGALLIYLPPYSPDLNPIEEAFSSAKSYLKSHEAIICNGNDIKMTIEAAFNSISADDCKGWFSDCGYL